ncbi:MAG: outer membrane protein assembly factor BamD [Candidatus Hydrogenedentes bacterium]|nr:outer membrane protein assembly factor BamD [Candidatus Hydrogenedentota bacterium]
MPRTRWGLGWLALLVWGVLAVTAPAVRAQQMGGGGGGGESLLDSDEATTELGAPKQKRPGWLFHRTAYDTVQEQMAYAERLLAKGKRRKAGKALNALVHRWHNTPEAARAQRLYAESLQHRRKSEKAFDEYQYLVHYFAGTFPYQDVLQTQFQLANDVRTARHGRLFVLPGFQDPGRAVPLYEQIVANGPNWDRAPEAQFNAGVIQEATGEPELAVVSYETLLLRYPRSDFVEEAAYRRAHALYALSRKSPRDEAQCREALSAMLAFARNYPADPHREDARRLAEELKNHLADMYYDRALYYDRIAKRPQSAIIAYSDYISKFPTSERRNVADQRVAALQLQLEENHEK